MILAREHAQRLEDRFGSVPLELLAERFAGSVGWRVWSWRDEDLRLSHIRIASPDDRMAQGTVTDAQRLRADHPLRPEVDVVEALVGELQGA